RTCPRDDEQGRVAVATLQQLGFKNVAIVHDNSAYARGLADEIRQGIEREKTAAIIFFDALVPNERDYSAILTKLKGLNPDVVFYTGYYNEAGLLLRQMAEMKWSVPMIGGDATNNTDLVAIAGAAAAGFRFISPPMPGDIDNRMAKEFLAAYQAKYNSQPSSIWSVAAGDALNVLVAAIRARGADPAAIAGFLHNDMKDGIDSLTGTIAFDEKGDRIGDLYRLYEVSADGRFVLQPK
ncbi:MAG: branched-chain amino acid ABC transporter substrate-binding protein, partial [Deltaproteobacteria bacterium]|nr:branched-chain amino acid ABC transporter substrate-binding protein [Deltaproteobacteria bacterium]